jgi:hypothetical protein
MPSRPWQKNQTRIYWQLEGKEKINTAETDDAPSSLNAAKGAGDSRCAGWNGDVGLLQGWRLALSAGH